MLHYEQYGKDGPLISRLGFGAMRLPTKTPEDYGDVNYAKATRVLRAAFSAGVNFIDSHHFYHEGNSELAIGKAFKGWKGNHIYIQTKAQWWDYNLKRRDFEEFLHKALTKLGVKTIDYYLMHSLQMDVWQKRGKQFIRFTDWALKRGLIQHRGFSSHETPENVRKFIDTGEFSAMVVSYNWMNRQMRDTIAHAADRGMGVAIMNPIGGGTLATRTPQIMRLLPRARNPAEIGLRYVLATPGVTCALSGMNEVRQVEENVATASRKRMLTSIQLMRMHDRLSKIEEKSKEFCTACGYCMPCEHGVDISRNFELLKQVKFFGRLKWARAQYSRLKNHPKGDRSATACKLCGKCLPKCPNKVPIIKQLQEVEALLS